MKLSNTTLLMILWFVCQQAAAVVAVFPFPGEPLPDVAVKEACHEGTSTDSASERIHDHDDATQSVECCEIGCQCCISGCPSVHSGQSNPATAGLSAQPLDLYSLVVPQTSASSLFRPPISR